MGKRLDRTVGIRVASEKWAAFELVARGLGLEPGDLLRELIEHAESAYKAMQAGRIASLNGDVSKWLAADFPAVSADQLRLFAAVLASAADKLEVPPAWRE